MRAAPLDPYEQRREQGRQLSCIWCNALHLIGHFCSGFIPDQSRRHRLWFLFLRGWNQLWGWCWTPGGSSWTRLLLMNLNEMWTSLCDNRAASCKLRLEWVQLNFYSGRFRLKTFSFSKCSFNNIGYPLIKSVMRFNRNFLMFTNNF